MATGTIKPATALAAARIVDDKRYWRPMVYLHLGKLADVEAGKPPELGYGGSSCAANPQAAREGSRARASNGGGLRVVHQHNSPAYRAKHPSEHYRRMYADGAEDGAELYISLWDMPWSEFNQHLEQLMDGAEDAMAAYVKSKLIVDGDIDSDEGNEGEYGEPARTTPVLLSGDAYPALPQAPSSSQGGLRLGEKRPRWPSGTGASSLDAQRSRYG